MSAQALPPSPNIDHLKNQAKELLEAFRRKETPAIRRVEAALRVAPFPSARTPRLADTQLTVAREYGFASWPKLKAHVAKVTTTVTSHDQLVDGDPAAWSVFCSMVDAFRNARRLSFTCQKSYTANNGSREYNGTTHIDMRKPDHVRHESWHTVTSFPEEHAIAVVNGRQLIGYWPEHRPKFSAEDEESYLQSRERRYYEKEVDGPEVIIGSIDNGIFGWSPTIPAHFFFWQSGRYPKNIEACFLAGTENVDGRECQIVDIAMRGNSFYRKMRVWIADDDHLPRRSSMEHTDMSEPGAEVENWSEIVIDADWEDTVLQWQPPADWTRWQLPPRMFLISPGTQAPDFTLPALQGGMVTLSKFRGCKVALALGWKLSRRTISEKSGRMQRLFQIAESAGIEIIAIDGSSLGADRLRKLAHDNDATYRLLQCLTIGLHDIFTAYGGYDTTFCIIDEDGIIVDSWLRDFERFESAVESIAGISLTTE